MHVRSRNLWPGVIAAPILPGGADLPGDGDRRRERDALDGRSVMRPRSLVVILIGGVLFGFGLATSTMIMPEVVLSFLQLRDLGLMLVLGGAVMVTVLAYSLAPRLMRKPLLESQFERHPSDLNRETILGAAIFGSGWGLCGVCPGPAIAGLGAGNWPLLIAVAGIFAGAFVHGRFLGRPSLDDGSIQTIPAGQP